MQIKNQTLFNKTELFLIDKILQNQNILSDGKILRISSKS